jgi:chaperone modulatory protein CbpM
MNIPLRKKVDETSKTIGVPVEVIIHFIEEEWVRPIDREHLMLDEEDEARIGLISMLKSEFEVNDESVPIILHLLDQLHYFHHRLRALD